MKQLLHMLLEYAPVIASHLCSSHCCSSQVCSREVRQPPSSPGSSPLSQTHGKALRGTTLHSHMHGLQRIRDVMPWWENPGGERHRCFFQCASLSFLGHIVSRHFPKCSSEVLLLTAMTSSILHPVLLFYTYSLVFLVRINYLPQSDHCSSAFQGDAG